MYFKTVNIKHTEVIKRGIDIKWFGNNDGWKIWIVAKEFMAKKEFRGCKTSVFPKLTSKQVGFTPFVMINFEDPPPPFQYYVKALNGKKNKTKSIDRISNDM